MVMNNFFTNLFESIIGILFIIFLIWIAFSEPHTPKIETQAEIRYERISNPKYFRKSS